MPPVTPKSLTEHRPLDWFETDPKELARHDDPEKIRLLGQDMLANGQLQAVGATEDARLIFGNGRWLAAKSAGMKTLETKLFPATLTDTQFRLIRAAENLQRNELTGYQKWLLAADLMSGNATWQMKDLAEALHLDPSMVTRLLSPSRCIPAAQEALAAGKIGKTKFGISDCYELSQESPERQAELLQLKADGVSRDAIKMARRKTRNGNGAGQPAQKATRMKCAVPGRKLSIQINSEQPFTLFAVIEAIQELMKEMKKAADRSLDPRTFERMCKDLAKPSTTR